MLQYLGAHQPVLASLQHLSGIRPGRDEAHNLDISVSFMMLDIWENDGGTDDCHNNRLIMSAGDVLESSAQIVANTHLAGDCS